MTGKLHAIVCFQALLTPVQNEIFKNNNSEKANNSFNVLNQDSLQKEL